MTIAVPSRLGPFHVLLNPASGGGAAGARWREAAAAASTTFPGFTLRQSEKAGDLKRFARELADSGEAATIIAAGGDGTSHEVLNGLLDPGGTGPGHARMGWLPLG